MLSSQRLLLLPCSGYDQYKEAWDTGYWGSVPMGGKNESVHFFHTYKQKARCHSSMAWHPSAVAGVRSSSQVDYVFVDHPTFLERVNGLTGLAQGWKLAPVCRICGVSGP